MSDGMLLEELRSRDLVFQMTGDDAFLEHLSMCSRTVYCGFDPTADSLHLGHLVPLLVLKRFQMAGHKPIALVGGATGMIGDPSFKAAERQLNTPAVVKDWSEKIRNQVSRFIDFDCGKNAALVVNNLDWTEGMGVLDFLRDVGKHFSINAMINKESVQQRLNRGGAGISFTEFSYALLQGLDFAQLNRDYNCTVQIGGSDQWGNIVGGIELARRQNQSQTYGVTVPLVTKADGTKFGKTESGAIWLDPAKTSPYSFYQFWLNAADADVYRFLRYFTFLDVQYIAEIEREDSKREGRPEAQSILAKEVTELVHGALGLAGAQRITESLFSGALEKLSEADLQQLKLDGLPSTCIVRGDLTERPLTQLLADAGMASSGKQVKDALARSAVLVNGQAIAMEQNMDVPACFMPANAFYGQYYLVKLGKKKYHLFDIN
jgi:tyrosyl-tRNA synthetase